MGPETLSKQPAMPPWLASAAAAVPPESPSRTVERLLRWYKHYRRLLPNAHLPLRPRGHDFRIYLNLRESRMMLKRALGVYEPEKTQLFRGLLKPGMTVVDVGVNKGYFTLLSASLVKETGRVVSFEPAPENCRWIRRSIIRNRFSNVTLFETALSNQSGKTQLYLGDVSGHHSLLASAPKRTGKSIEVGTDTLDNVLDGLGVGEIDLLKIDVEGAELGVLRGSRNILQRSPQPVVIMDLHPKHGVSPEEIVRELESLDLAVYANHQGLVPAASVALPREILAFKQPLDGNT